jgi:hypothetical protein
MNLVFHKTVLFKPLYLSLYEEQVSFADFPGLQAPNGAPATSLIYDAKVLSASGLRGCSKLDSISTQFHVLTASKILS